MGRRKDQAQFNMRLDRPLLKQLQNAAKDQDRSVNSEMLHRLEQSFTRDSIQDRLTAIAGKIDQLLERRRDAGARDDLEQYVMRLAPGERDRLRTALDRALSRDAEAMRRAEECYESPEPELPMPQPDSRESKGGKS